MVALGYDDEAEAQAARLRQYVRTDYVARVYVGADGTAARAKCVTLNVSGGGLLIRGMGGGVGDDLTFLLELGSGEPPIRGGCRIVRQTPEGLRGVQFTELEEADRQRLVAFVLRRERAQRDSLRAGG